MADKLKEQQDEEFDRNASAYAKDVASASPDSTDSDGVMEFFRVQPDDDPGTIRMKQAAIQGALRVRAFIASGENPAEYSAKNFGGFKQGRRLASDQEQT